jgi:peptidoglycan/xylan/chitin deacetylase (PgdA/CDA1 family)
MPCLEGAMFLAVVLAVSGAFVLFHTAPFPLALDALHARQVVWRMPHGDGPPTVYLTYDDGPNPAATPALLDVLRDEGVTATFFLIERHVTPATAAIVRRIADEGHAIGLHSHTRRLLLRSPPQLGRELQAFAGRLEAIAGRPPCRAFRPHAGARGSEMLEGLRRIDHQLVGWGWMLWDFDFFRPRSARIVPRLASRASPGDIVVIHDGHHEDPRADRRAAIDITRALVPALRRRGFGFGRICGPDGAVPAGNDGPAGTVEE